MKSRFLSIFLLLSLIILCACSKKEAENETISIRSPREGIATVNALSKAIIVTKVLASRPSSQMGIFTSSFLAQKGAFVSTASAKNSINNHSKLLDSNISTNDTFLLLADIANILQVDIVDVLNRSTDRSEALNKYTETLKNIGKVVEHKFKELEEEETQKREEKKEKRTAVSRLEREINTAYKNEEFGNAASRQEELTEAESELAKISSELDNTSDLINRYEDMIEIAYRRLIAIEKNREILIAGLKVTDVPGIENFDILEEGKKYKRLPKTDGKSLFGTEFIE